MSNIPIPISDQRPPSIPAQPRYWPVVTLVILGINVVVFLAMTLAGGSTNTNVLLDFGASFSPYFRRGEYWRLVMPMFLHIGWLHLAVNSYALFLLGPILERVYGYGRFALLYVAAGMGSSAVSMSLSRNIAAGASGAIFGIAGAMLVAGYLHREVIPPRWGRALGRGILPFIVLNLILGFSVKGIDNWGHLGGLLSGMVLAALIPPPAHDLAPQFGEARPSQAVIALPVVVVALAMASTAQHYVRSREVTRLLWEGAQLHAAHQEAKALERFRTAAQRSPHDTRPHMMMADLYTGQKLYSDAIQHYKEALQIEPDSAVSHNNLAWLYATCEDPKWRDPRSALEHARRAVELTQWKEAGFIDTLAEANYASGSYQEAVRIQSRALQLEPQDPELQEHMARYRKAAGG
jgi:rhomboid protease GluP